jgi:predicted dehydrogenase
MAIDLKPEERKVGEENFKRAVDGLGLNRREFLKAGAAATAAVAGTAAAAYFGYKSSLGRPVKAALIGGGDEGGVLVGEHNPEFLEFVAVCDIRPSNMKRIFEGDPKVALRKGFNKVYGKDEATKIKKYDDYRQMLKDNPEVEAVVIALPLHLHARAAIDAMRIGQERGRPIHVLTEKLMAWNIQQCKAMIRTAKETNSILSVGHQRHYSLLYAHAVEVMRSGILGDVKHIRALWHRNFSWPFKADASMKLVAEVTQPYYRDGWFPPVTHEDYDALNGKVQQYGFDNVEQLVRWRLYAETGGGLMAELGSHQLDACSIFLGHKRPLAVTGVGGKFFFGEGKNNRNIDDHVFCTYEFPGKNYDSDKNDVVVVTYSSVSTNSFENYGECIMGSRGSMVVESERTVMLYTEKDPTKKGPANGRSIEAGVVKTKSGEPALDTSSTWGGPSAGPTAVTAPGGAAAPAAISRGYREEMEDFAYCVRLWDPKEGYAPASEGHHAYKQRLPRCHGEIAMADAIVALTANRAMHERQRIVFDDKWFASDKDDVPDDPKAKPKIPV